MHHAHYLRNGGTAHHSMHSGSSNLLTVASPMFLNALIGQLHQLTCTDWRCWSDDRLDLLAGSTANSCTDATIIETNHDQTQTDLEMNRQIDKWASLLVTSYCHTRTDSIEHLSQPLQFILLLPSLFFSSQSQCLLLLSSQWKTIQHPYPHQLQIVYLFQSFFQYSSFFLLLLQFSLCSLFFILQSPKSGTGAMVVCTLYTEMIQMPSTSHLLLLLQLISSPRLFLFPFCFH